MSASIETTQVDAFVQDVCRNRDITPAERGQQAALALSVHVAQEHSLLIGTSLPVDEEEVVVFEEHLERRAALAMDDLMEKSFEVFEWMENQYPEGQAIPALLTLIKTIEDENEVSKHKLVAESMEGEATHLMPRIPMPEWQEPTAEEQDKFNRWYNDDKDEQQ